MDYLNNYLDNKKLDHKTKYNYKLWLDRLFKFSNKDTKSISLDDLNKFYLVYSPKFAPKTLQLAFNIYHTYFTYWEKSIKINPRRIEVPKARSNSHYSITLDEHQKILKLLAENDFRQLQTKLILSMLFDTGVRIGELTSIKLQNISPHQCDIDTEKTAKKRTIFWGKETERLLQRYLPIRKEIKRSDNLFVGIYVSNRGYSNRISSRSIERKITKLRKRAGLKNKIVPHSYRHSRIRRWFDSGLSPHHIILLSGHESTISLEHYMRLGAGEISNLAKRFM